MIGIAPRARLVTPIVAAALAALSATAQAQIAVSANDGKVKLDNGVVKIIKDGVDTVSLIDLNANPPKSVGEVNAPTSVAGPPSAVAITPNEQIALVTSATKIDPADPTKTVPNDVLSVIDITRGGGMLQNAAARIQGKAPSSGYEPKVLATLTVGKGAAGVAINKAGTLGLVANRSEGTVSVLDIKGRTVSVQAEKIKLGAENSGPSGIVFTPDGKTALVTRDNDHKISVLAIDGNKVTDTKREMSAGMRPYGIDMGPKGDFAVVANIGTGSGDSDTVSLIDMTMKPPRIVNTVSVGQTPEGIKISPDGNYIAVSAMNGTNKAKDNPFFNEKGKVVILRRQDKTLVRHAEADVGRWCQGLAWSSNGRKLVVQCMFEEQIVAFNWNGRILQLAGTIKTTGGPASIRTAEK
jgi:DNA-binding beta-propeller fold protein YncE